MNSDKAAQHLTSAAIQERRPVSVALIAVSSPHHYTLWNAFAAETLAGDLRGALGNLVRVGVYRVRSTDEIERIAYIVKRLRPDMAAISVECGGVTLSLELAERLTSGDASNGHCLSALIFGGKIPTYLPDVFLNKCSSAIVVLGEGELSLRRLVRRLLERAPERLEDIPNLAFWDSQESIRRTAPERPRCSELTFPPSLDTVSELIEAGPGTVLTQASRGCSWSKCSFCTIPSFRFQEKWEPLPWSRTRKHLEALASLGVREFEFCDDEFMGGRDPQHIERISRIAGDLEAVGRHFESGIVFRIFLIPHTIYRHSDPAGNAAVRSALERLRDAGLRRVYLGVESGSERQLKRYCRGTPLADVMGALNVLRDLRLGIDCGFIMFDLLATVDDIAQNVRFFRANGLIVYNQWPFRPLVANLGSRFGRMMLRRGMHPDPEYMCYRYRFNDPGVQKIFEVVDLISSETRSLFYTLKVISKSHFDPGLECRESRRAREVVIANGLIYLDLIDDLVHAVTSSGADGLVARSAWRARERVQALLVDVEHDLNRGVFRDPHGRLRYELSEHRPGFRATPHAAPVARRDAIERTATHSLTILDP
ncbi:MAG: radical SAM protein [Planctomycetota bacterium]